MVGLMHEILTGDSLTIMRSMDAGSFQAIITDPPYSSGGMYRGDRVQAPITKYSSVSSSTGIAPYFEHEWDGDSMDQRTWVRWTTEWLTLARHITTPGGVCAIFTDWRQVAALYDALGFSGWVLRGLMPWDKKNARPQPARPRQQCEFIAWASNGPMSVQRDADYMPGIFTCAAPPPLKRAHQTEKPLEVMRQLVHICERDGRILDPFAGSGSTIRAALLEGYSALGIERNEYHAAHARELLEEMRDTP